MKENLTYISIFVFGALMIYGLITVLLGNTGGEGGNGLNKQESLIQNTTAVPYDVIETGYYAGRERDAVEVARTQEEFNDVWNKIYTTTTPKPAQPEIDFKTRMAATFFRGFDEDLQHTSRVTDVRESTTEIWLFVENVFAGRNCPDPQRELGKPYVIVSIPQKEKSVTFITTDTVSKCK